MTLKLDLLSIACAEYCERNGQKGVFIPEVPNFKYTPGTGTRRNASPPRAMMNINLYKSNNPAKRYDYAARQMIPQEHLDAYLNNPNTVSRSRYVAFGYNYKKGLDDGPVPASTAADVEKLLKD